MADEIAPMTPHVEPEQFAKHFSWRGPEFKDREHYIGIEWPLGTECWWVSVTMHGRVFRYFGSTPHAAVQAACEGTLEWLLGNNDLDLSAFDMRRADRAEDITMHPSFRKASNLRRGLTGESWDDAEAFVQAEVESGKTIGEVHEELLAEISRRTTGA